MLVRINPEKPDDKSIREVADVMRRGGLVIYPTDTVYAVGCDIYQPKAIARLYKLKGIPAEMARFSMICSDISNLADFARPITNNIFRVLKKALPGPYTFIFEANANVPKIFQSKRKTVGLRVPNNKITLGIVKALGNPIVSTSVHDLSDEMLEYYSDPELIYANYKDKVDLVINGGFGNLQPSTVIDVSTGTFKVIREGQGPTAGLWQTDV
jgi:tRNA threonylcarbamoyl adenosine modification protein (Sua5/YciO/YrdC/YwlC family)